MTGTDLAARALTAFGPTPPTPSMEAALAPFIRLVAGGKLDRAKGREIKRASRPIDPRKHITLRKIISVLLDHPATAYQIAEIAGLHVNTVYSSLKVMIEDQRRIEVVDEIKVKGRQVKVYGLCKMKGSKEITFLAITSALCGGDMTVAEISEKIGISKTLTANRVELLLQAGEIEVNDVVHVPAKGRNVGRSSRVFGLAVQ